MKANTQKRLRSIRINEPIQGTPASPGIAVGRPFYLDRGEMIVCEEAIRPSAVNKEIKKFRTAIRRAVQDLERLQNRVSGRIDPQVARIFTPQIMLANDEVVNERVEERIRRERKVAEYIYREEMEQALDALSNSKDSYFNERVIDIKAVLTRVIHYLRGTKHVGIPGVGPSDIVLARTVTPADVVQMAHDGVRGFATETGGATSHVALLAKAFGITAVVGLKYPLGDLNFGDTVIVNGYSGEFFPRPGKKMIRDCTRQQELLRKRDREYREEKSLETRTTDGKRIQIAANIELSSEVKTAVEYGADGVGLYRTEYLYLLNSRLPTEAEQFEMYKSAVETMAPWEVIIRTFDFGGDKFLDSRSRVFEVNPFLGWRAIRVSLDRPKFFVEQLRAILKASAFGNVGIMLPMVSTIEEVRRAKAILTEVKESFIRKGIQFDRYVRLGIMIEVPSAALISDALAQEVDFFSIGTNDLIQYTIAVDRGNELVSPLYQSYHPAVLRLIKLTVDNGRKHRIPVSLCGEMASDPLAACILVGLGIDKLSVNPIMLPVIRRVIKSINSEEARAVAEQALGMSCAKDISTYLQDRFRSVFEEIEDLTLFMLR